MMKNTFMFLWLTLVFFQLNAQDQQVISSAGDVDQGNSIQLDWTLGETVIPTIQNSTLLVTQGFHQPNYLITSLNELPAEIGQITVFPNPTSDRIEMKLDFEEHRKVQIVLVDLTGKIIWTKESNTSQVQETTDISHLPSGNYILNFLIDDSKFSKSLKIQKIN